MIGVFDSGIGGLTVLRELITKFPSQSFIYIGDTARLPYGNKSPQTIKKYTIENLKFLKKMGVNCIVIACNSASTQMLDSDWEGVPLYNVVIPGVKKTIMTLTGNRVGVIGTRATIQSQIYEKKLKEVRSDLEVYSQSCPLFVPLAEEGLDADPITNLIAYRYLTELLKNNIEALILGCTHYPLLKNSIQRCTGSHIALIDSGEAIAQQIQADLAKNTKLLSGKQEALSELGQSSSEQVSELKKSSSNNSQQREIKIMLTDNSDLSQTLVRKIMPEDINYSIATFDYTDTL